jgi:lysozyme
MSPAASRPRSLALLATLTLVLGGRLAHAGDSAPQLPDAGADTSTETPDDCGEPRRLSGIDVSYYQGIIDWKRVHAAGIVFAFARISDGIAVVDPRFVANMAGMRHARVRRGAYQYFRAGADPIAQAKLAIHAVHHAGGLDLPLVADVETDDGQPLEMVQAQLARWLRYVERHTHRRPMIYTSPSLGTQLLGGRFGGRRLWVAHYTADCPALPSGWARWTFWQRSNTGRVDGIVGPVDLDDFAGSPKTLRRLRRRERRHAD